MFKFRAVVTPIVAIVICAVIALLTATSAEARRRISFGGSKSSSGATKSAPTVTKPLTFDKVMLGALLGRSVTKASRSSLTKVFHVPESEKTLLPDGRHLHIGELAGSWFSGKSYVGWVSTTEYVKVNQAQLEHLIELAGFGSLEVFEDHLESMSPPSQSQSQDAATSATPAPEAPVAASEGLSTLAMAAIAGLSALLLGFVGYCLMSMRTASAAPSAPPPAATTRIARVAPATNRAAAASAAPARAVAPVAAAQPRTPRIATPVAVKAPAAATETTPRRAPRDLSALTRRPQPA